MKKRIRLAKSTNDLFKIYMESLNAITPKTDKEQKELGLRYRNGDLKAREELIKCNLKFVVQCAKVHIREGTNFMDLVQCGNEGLIRAYETCDFTRDSTVLTYASWWIHQYMNQNVKNTRSVRVPKNRLAEFRIIKNEHSVLESKLGREPTMSELAKSLSLDKKQIDRYIIDSRTVSSLDQIIDQSLNDNPMHSLLADPKSQDRFNPVERRTDMQRTFGVVRKILNNDRKFDIICRRTGYQPENDIAEQTFEEISNVYNTTPEGVRGIEMRAYKKIRNAPKKYLKQLEEQYQCLGH